MDVPAATSCSTPPTRRPQLLEATNARPGLNEATGPRLSPAARDEGRTGRHRGLPRDARAVRRPRHRRAVPANIGRHDGSAAKTMLAQPPPAPAEMPPFPDTWYRTLVIGPPVADGKDPPRQVQRAGRAPRLPDDDAAGDRRRCRSPTCSTPTAAHAFFCGHPTLPPRRPRAVRPLGCTPPVRLRVGEANRLHPVRMPDVERRVRCVRDARPASTAHSTRQGQAGFTAPNRGHSVKPFEFFDQVRAMTHEPRLDLFARQPHNGFDGWGSEYAALNHSGEPT